MWNKQGSVGLATPSPSPARGHPGMSPSPQPQPQSVPSHGSPPHPMGAGVYIDGGDGDDRVIITGDHSRDHIEIRGGTGHDVVTYGPADEGWAGASAAVLLMVVVAVLVAVLLRRRAAG